jgi:hypothetical protein
LPLLAALIVRSGPMQLFSGTSINFLDFLLMTADRTDVPSKTVQTSKPIGRSGSIRVSSVTKSSVAIQFCRLSGCAAADGSCQQFWRRHAGNAAVGRQERLSALEAREKADESADESVEESEEQSAEQSKSGAGTKRPAARPGWLLRVLRAALRLRNAARGRRLGELPAVAVNRLRRRPRMTSEKAWPVSQSISS